MKTKKAAKKIPPEKAKINLKRAVDDALLNPGVAVEKIARANKVHAGELAKAVTARREEAKKEREAKLAKKKAARQSERDKPKEVNNHDPNKDTGKKD